MSVESTGRERSRLVAVAIGCGVSLAIVAVAWSIGLFTRADNLIFDFQMQQRGPLPADERVVIVGVTDTTFGLLGMLSPGDLEQDPLLGEMTRPWPWSRAVHARVLHKLLDAGAALVAVDFVFAGPGEGDDDLAAVIEEFRDRIVLAYTYTDVRDTAVEERRIEIRYPWDDLLPLDDDDDMLGFANVDPDEDRSIRRLHPAINLLAEFDPAFADNEPDLFSLALMTAWKADGGGDLVVPQGELLINYAGPRGSYTAVSVEDLFLPGRWQTRLLGGDVFKDKIVIYGPMAEVFKDYHPTPFGIMDGPEIHANMVASLLQDSLISGLQFNPLGLAVVGILCAALIGWRIRSAATKVVVLIAATGVLVVVIQVAFVAFSLYIPASGMLAGFLIMGSWAGAADLILEQAERRRVRQTLDRYVAPNVAARILRDRDALNRRLRGSRQEVTILFSDIRGFTALSEALDPEAFVDQLNEYFEAMVETVFTTRGTLQKFIGDAILAVWGDTHKMAPAEQAALAVEAALLMRTELESLNREWEAASGRTQISIGIGINTGEAIVGNIGHSRRMEFTVLGDTVNLAARLESATKFYGEMILVGERLMSLAKDTYRFRLIDRVAVKGKTKPENVYAPTGLKEDPELDWEKAYNKALGLYFERNFEDAVILLRDVLQLKPGDPSSLRFIERAGMLIQHPPAADWDGSFVMEHK